MLKKLLKDNVSDINDDDNIDKLSRMILRVTARAFLTLPTRKDKTTKPATDTILPEVQQILTSEVYPYDPFAAEVLVEIIQIAKPGDCMNLCYTLCPNQKGHSLCHGGFCPEDQELHNCSSFNLMKEINSVLNESSYVFGEFDMFVNNFRTFCPNKPGPYLNCPDASDFEGWVQASLINITKRILLGMGVNCFLFSLAGLSCGIMEKMFRYIEREDDMLGPTRGKFTIVCDSVHVSYFGSYKGPTVEQQCALCYRVIKAISDARNAHLNVVKEKGSENISLLDSLVANTALPFVTNDKFVIALLSGCFKPHRPRGTGSGTNSIDKLAKKEAEDNWKKQLKEEELLYPRGFDQHQTASRLSPPSRSPGRNERSGSTTSGVKAKCDFYVCTIFDKAVYIAKTLTEMIEQLGKERTTANAVNAKAVKAAIMEHGYYPYCGIKFCKVIPLGDWIEMAPQDQRGKNDHL